MCRALGVNRTSFHDWERRAPSDRALSDAWLTEKIKQIHAASDGTYGARRIHAELRLEHGIRVGRKRVERLMRAPVSPGLWRASAGAPPSGCPASGSLPTWSSATFARRPEPDVVGGHHLHLDLGRVPVPRARPGPVLPADRRLVDGRPPALRARRRRARDGACPTSPRPGLIHHSIRAANTPRCCSPSAAPRPGSRSRWAQSATAMTTPSARPSTRASRRRRSTGNRGRPAPRRARGLRVHRGLVQPPAPALHARLPLPDRVRTTPRRARPPALEASISANGSVASTSPSASDGLTTRRISTVGVDFAADRSISPENALVLPTDPAQAATDGGQGTNGNGWPLRSVVKEQAR